MEKLTPLQTISEKIKADEELLRKVSREKNKTAISVISSRLQFLRNQWANLKHIEENSWKSSKITDIP